MGKIAIKPSTIVYPVPAVMVSCGHEEKDHNIITIAWTGTINSAPPMTYVSIRKERHSHDIISKTKEFVINLTTESLAYETDYCGVHSGKDVNKFSEMKLTKGEASSVLCPTIEESPVSIECRVTQVLELGSHDMFIAEVVGVTVDDKYMDESGNFDLNASKLICYSGGKYFSLSEFLGYHGYSKNK